MQAISQDQKAEDLKELDLDQDELPVEKALGLQWCVETDSFRFKTWYAVTSSVYDPLGFLALVTLLAKINSVGEVVAGMMVYHKTSYINGKGDWRIWICWLHSRWKGVLNQWTLERSDMPNCITLLMPAKEGTEL